MTSHEYLLQISITHSKNLSSILYLLINCMSARSVYQILALEKKYFAFLKSSTDGLVLFISHLLIFRSSLCSCVSRSAFRFFVEKL